MRLNWKLLQKMCNSSEMDIMDRDIIELQCVLKDLVLLYNGH